MTASKLLHAEEKGEGQFWVPLVHSKLSVTSLPRVLREQWIRAKYERKEFTEPGKQLPYSDGKSRAQHQHIPPVAFAGSF